MSLPAIEIVSPGPGATLQDAGRIGWRRFGVPAGGAMDDHAAAWANRLLLNPPGAPVLELLWQGAKLACLRDGWVAITGAEVSGGLPAWRAVHLRAGEMIAFPRVETGLWTYVAVEGGFEAPRLLGSASPYPRGGLGRACERGEVLHRAGAGMASLAPGVAGRFVGARDRRDYRSPPPLRVWPGPQWDAFGSGDREIFFAQEWTISSQSDRVGYRLAGPTLKTPPGQIISEPVSVGSVQIPDNGQPIVTMRDGPTVGGYPKLGVVDPADVSWLAQCRPGQRVRFRPATAEDVGPQ